MELLNLGQLSSFLVLNLHTLNRILSCFLIFFNQYLKIKALWTLPIEKISLQNVHYAERLFAVLVLNNSAVRYQVRYEDLRLQDLDFLSRQLVVFDHKWEQRLLKHGVGRAQVRVVHLARQLFVSTTGSNFGVDGADSWVWRVFHAAKAFAKWRWLLFSNRNMVEKLLRDLNDIQGNQTIVNF